jgi:hypothetical protein
MAAGGRSRANTTAPWLKLAGVGEERAMLYQTQIRDHGKQEEVLANSPRGISWLENSRGWPAAWSGERKLLVQVRRSVEKDRDMKSLGRRARELRHLNVELGKDSNSSERQRDVTTMAVGD